MRILDRYLIKGFLRPFAACIAIFCILVTLGRFFDKMEIFNNFHAKAKDVIIYLLLGLPYWLNLVMPVATLLALLFSLGQLQIRGEITACRGAGISSLRLHAPYYGIGLALSILSLLCGLTFLPQLNFKMRGLYRIRIKQQERAVNYQQDHVVLSGRHHRRYTIDWLDVEHNHIKDIVVDRFGDNLQWLETLSAHEAFYQDGRWKFLDGALRRYDPQHPGVFSEERFKERYVGIPETPSDFIVEDKMADDMTVPEILARIERCRLAGMPTYKDRVALHMKMALPFANLVVIVLGIPFALKSSHKGRVQTFSFALLVSFFYWGVASVCQSFGEQGHIPAWVAAWAANVVFLAAAFGMLRSEF